ncbi:MAG: hypothetical protein ACO1OF_13995 [Adhaeribacter sp.]
MQTIPQEITPLPTLQVADEHYDFIYRLRQEYHLNLQDVIGLILSAALIEFYLTILKDEYKTYGYQTKEDFIQGLLALTQTLKPFAKIDTSHSFRRKAALYKTQKQISPYEALKSLVSKKMNNCNSKWQKITEAEYTFMEDFLLKYPLADNKTVYTALKKKFGTVSIQPGGVDYQRKRIIQNINKLIASKKPR